MDQAIQEKISKLQLIEESLHSYLAQKQQVQAQLLEFESAAESLDGAKSTYKIIGSVMVEQPAAAVKKDLDEKMERIKVRVDSLDKQEKRLKDQADALQKEIMDVMVPKEQHDHTHDKHAHKHR